MTGRIFIGGTILAGFSLSAGCGGNAGSARVPLHGSVEVEGASVSKGSLTLLPAEGHSGVAASTSIADGQYTFTETTGPVPGPHRAVVGVLATEETRGADANATVIEERRPADAAIKTAPPGPERRKSPQTSEASADRSASRSQWELPLEVPSAGDYRVDLKFGTK